MHSIRPLQCGCEALAQDKVTASASKTASRQLEQQEKGENEEEKRSGHQCSRIQVVQNVLQYRHTSRIHRVVIPCLQLIHQNDMMQKRGKEATREKEGNGGKMIELVGEDRQRRGKEMTTSDDKDRPPLQLEVSFEELFLVEKIVEVLRLLVKVLERLPGGCACVVC